MGMSMSLLAQGLPSMQTLNFVMRTIHKQCLENIDNVHDFQNAVNDIFNAIFSGMHYNAPSVMEVEELFTQWKKAKSGRNKMFVEFMKKSLTNAQTHTGQPSKQELIFVLRTLYAQSTENINSFEDFKNLVHDIVNAFSSVLPVMDFNPPSQKEVEDCYTIWNEAKEPERKKIFITFMMKKVNPSILDDTKMIARIVTAAMVIKRAGGTVPELRVVKDIPNIVFVPSATMLALIYIKLSNRI
ncbi:putative Calcium ion binding protein [Quillaja saponaria]|uniref:Calcium ion binding protein n=1 Tax=Quillaja saponaria TaxID=32244 RepID=A0AAD7LPV3_QUISA|nr:putative Calcium ion binding protein [Quillaja saponaria]